MAAVEAADVFEENEMLTMGAVEGFHIDPLRVAVCDRLIAHLEAQLERPVASLAPAVRPRGLRSAVRNCQHSHSFPWQPTFEGATVETLTAHRATGLDPIRPATPESSVSAVTWPAIFGGAMVAAATSIVLVALGSGLGLASVSPWRDSGASATEVAWMTAAWLIVVQWLSAGLGGY